MATVIRGDDNFDTAYAKSVAIIADVKSVSTDGGTNTINIWQTRDLNTEIDDPENIVSISANQFTLQAGKYLIEWSCPAYAVNRHVSRLYNITTSTVEGEGTALYSSSSAGNVTTGAAIVTVASANALEIQHYTQTAKAGDGFGVDVITGNSVYTLVKIHKIGA
jgi:hypothetical protein